MRTTHLLRGLVAVMIATVAPSAVQPAMLFAAAATGDLFNTGAITFNLHVPMQQDLPDEGKGKPVLLFLLGGQSNMEGSGDPGRMATLHDQAPASVHLWHNPSNAWVALGAPEALNIRGTFGPERSFGQALARALPDREIRLVKFAVGGSGLAEHWDPDQPGSYYHRLVEEARTAIARLKAQGRDVRVGGMLWMQGEQDAKDTQHPGNARAYEANLRALIRRVRTAFDVPVLLFLIGQIHDALLHARPHAGVDFGQANVVRAAMAAVAAASRHVGLVDTDGFSLKADSIHFDTQGTLDLGAAFARAYLALSEEEAPRVERPATEAGAEASPNVIVFLVDDLGWQDTSVPFHAQPTPFNHRYRTPHLEQLARQGLVFTNAYAASPVCTPTRTSLMTGRHPARTHITNWTLHNDRDQQETGPKHYPLRSPEWNVMGLRSGDVTLPEVLRTHGYRTIHVGKAHFGALSTPGADPTNLGFDVNIAGHAAGGPGSYYSTHNFSGAHHGADRVWDVPGLDRYHGQDLYLTDALTREANRVIAEAVADGTPFFLNMAHYAVHAPIMADLQYVGHYEGMDPVEAAYASMVEGYDASLGAILGQLDALGVADNTLMLFMSDNGGLSAHARGTTPMGTGLNTHNLPLRSGKGSAYEGGIRVPMIVAWARPDSDAAAQDALSIEAGSTTDVPVISDDFFPTILEIAGAAVPEDYSYDGHSLVPLLRGAAAPDRNALYWHYPHKWGPEGPGLDPFTAVREDDWKLIYFYQDRRWELYDLARDLNETTDLVWARPQVARHLAEKMVTWMKEVGAQVPHVRATDQPVALPVFD